MKQNLLDTLNRILTYVWFFLSFILFFGGIYIAFMGNMYGLLVSFVMFIFITCDYLFEFYLPRKKLNQGTGDESN